MKTVCFFVLGFFAINLLPAMGQESPSDWQTWRGPTSNGITEGQAPPTDWAADKNVIWKVAVPGRGHASPTIVGDKIFLATADDAARRQMVVAFDRASGESLWEKEIHQGNFNPNIHGKNTHASSTIASDGERVFVVFNNKGGVWLTALTLDGEIAYQKEVGKYRPTYPFGFGASPIVQDGKLFVTSESDAENFVLALNPADGEEVYRISRAKGSSYSTPVVAPIGESKQLLLSGCGKVKGYNAENGDELWTAKPAWQVSCGTMVWHENIVFTSGGFPQPQTLAIDATNGNVLWTTNVKCYEQSMIVVDGFLYGQSDRGVIYCWRAEDGKEMWKNRADGPVSASPVLAGGNLYFTSENGLTFVIKPNPEEFQLVSKNKLGESAFASMTMLDNRIYTRIGDRKAARGRQEWLYCLGVAEE